MRSGRRDLSAKEEEGRQRQENLVPASNNLCQRGDVKQEETALSYREGGRRGGRRGEEQREEDGWSPRHRAGGEHACSHRK